MSPWAEYDPQNHPVWPPPDGKPRDMNEGVLVLARRLWVVRTAEGQYMRRVRYQVGDVLVLEVKADDESEMTNEALTRADRLLGERLRRALEDA